ncbi:hypothetical protein BDV93DRAFT_549139 [Ceratobasidium sp. AG-I]|nr:hypothetical protein BDV93DRAFT_549139 [Ceratobasidium sp. AG-I]
MSTDNNVSATGEAKPTQDCSSTIYVINKLSVPLTLNSQSSTHGDWSPDYPPVHVINSGDKSNKMVLKDKLFGPGSEGSLGYLVGSTPTSVVMKFACPISADNWANISVVPDDPSILAPAPPFDQSGPLIVTFSILPAKKDSGAAVEVAPEEA